METMVRLGSARRIAWVLVTAMMVPYLSVAAFAAPKPASPARSMVVFPLEGGAGAANSQIANELTGMLSDALSNYPSYRVLVYSERLPAVQRLVTLQPDKKDVTAGPFSTDEAAVGRAVVLGKAMLADVLIVGSIGNYVFDDKAGTADVTMSAEVLDGTSGKSIQEITVTGRGVGRQSRLEGASETSVRRDALKDVVRKAMKAITGEEYLEPKQGPAPVIRSEKKKSSWIPILLLSLGVGILLGGSGRGGGTPANTGGTDNPPPPPL